MDLIGRVGGRGVLHGPLARAPRCLLALQSARGPVPGVVRGSALMPQGRSSSRSLRAQRLCKVHGPRPGRLRRGHPAVRQELRARHAEPAHTPHEWRALGPSAELMVSPEYGARCIVRDTRVPGADRFRWTVAVLGQLDSVAEGRAKNRAEARSLAEAAVSAYFADRADPSGGGSACDG